MESSPQNAGPDELPWDRDPFHGWRDTVNGWRWRKLGPGHWEKGDDCPRCKHEMSIEKGGAYTQTIDVEARDMEEPALGVEEDREEVLYRVDGEIQHLARCNCGGDHPGRPPEVTRGCGQKAMIDPPPEDD